MSVLEFSFFRNYIHPKVTNRYRIQYFVQVVMPYLIASLLKATRCRKSTKIFKIAAESFSFSSSYRRGILWYLLMKKQIVAFSPLFCAIF